jgi:hypothetical protein
VLPKTEVEARLKALGAFYCIDIDDQHEVWGTTWGFFVWIPMAGPLRGLPEDVLEDIEHDIRQSKP